MQPNSDVFVGVDVAKARYAVAVAENGKSAQGEVRFLGEIDADPLSVSRLIARLEKRHARLHFCHEAGPTGYGLHRQLTAMGHRCEVVAPSLIPRRPGDRVKTNRRDALQLARLLRAGELTAVWVPDEAHEAMRELIRSREAAVDDLRRKRQSISSLMLRYGRIYQGKTTWGARQPAVVAGSALRSSGTAISAAGDAVGRAAREGAIDHRRLSASPPPVRNRFDTGNAIAAITRDRRIDNGHQSVRC